MSLRVQAAREGFPGAACAGTGRPSCADFDPHCGPSRCDLPASSAAVTAATSPPLQGGNPITRRSRRALWLALAALLLGSAAPSQAVQLFAPEQNSPNPAQLAAAAAVFVRVDSKSGTDTLLIVNRQQADDATTTGTAIAIHVRFYDANCHLTFDNNVSLTPQGIFVGLVSQIFGINAPGVILADSHDATSAAWPSPRPSTQLPPSSPSPAS